MTFAASKQYWEFVQNQTGWTIFIDGSPCKTSQFIVQKASYYLFIKLWPKPGSMLIKLEIANFIQVFCNSKFCLSTFYFYVIDLDTKSHIKNPEIINELDVSGWWAILMSLKMEFFVYDGVVR